MSQQKTVRHASKALRKGFTIVPNVLLLDPAISAGALRVYAVFNYLAWATEDEWPGQDELGPKFLGVKDPKTIRRWIADLEELGLLKSTRRGRGLTNLYEVFLPDEAESQNGKNARSGTGKNHPPERANTPSPKSEQFKNTEDTPQPPGGQIIKFGRKTVPFDRLCCAIALLETFNEKANTSYGPWKGNAVGEKPSEGLKRIIGAVMEHPEIEVETGERMIALAFAGGRYWEPEIPQPGNVFGPGVVEKHLQAALRRPQPQQSASIVDRLDARRKAA